MGDEYFDFYFSPEITIEKMLLDFASKLNLNTNILDNHRYSFIFRQYVLNIPYNLSKSLKQMFGKYSDKLIIIKVIDHGIILG